MRLSKKAQYLIEYGTLVVLVMVGIIIMGPYIIRSINAYFKSMETGVKESFEEVIKQADEETYVFPPCECSDPVPTNTCGDGTLCAPNERLYERICTPLGCLEPTLCLVDPNCCDPWVNSLGQNGLPLCFHQAVNVSGGCEDCYVQQQAYCLHIDQTIYRCRYDVSCCYECAGAPLANISEWCYDPESYTNLPERNIPVIYYDAGHCPASGTDEAKCALKCLIPYNATDDGSGCECATTSPTWQQAAPLKSIYLSVDNAVLIYYANAAGNLYNKDGILLSAAEQLAPNPSDAVINLGYPDNLDALRAVSDPLGFADAYSNSHEYLIRMNPYGITYLAAIIHEARPFLGGTVDDLTPGAITIISPDYGCFTQEGSAYPQWTCPPNAANTLPPGYSSLCPYGANCPWQCWIYNINTAAFQTRLLLKVDSTSAAAPVCDCPTGTVWAEIDIDGCPVGYDPAGVSPTPGNCPAGWLGFDL